jgi:hypothetical protein
VRNRIIFNVIQQYRGLGYIWLGFSFSILSEIGANRKNLLERRLILPELETRESWGSQKTCPNLCAHYGGQFAHETFRVLIAFEVPFLYKRLLKK